MFHHANKSFFFPKRFLLLAMLLFLFPLSPLRAAKNAIGVRVARNAEHLSPSAWYDKYAPGGNGNSGPASISFAGYEAVSVGSCSSGKGETIYVNAANIVDVNNTPTDPNDDALYTNIYIIACPIGADQDIADIFDQLIKNWDFNVNITDKSEQGKIQRDTKRLSDITILNDLLENYHANNSRYPALASGTYEAGKTISSWTSWNDTLGAQFKSALPTPPVGAGWGPLTSLEDWKNADGEKVWPKDMYFPTGVGVDYTFSGCRQITAVKDQKAASWCEGGCVGECGSLSYSTTALPWPADVAIPDDIAVNYQDTFSSSCRELFIVQNGKYSILKDNYSTTADGCFPSIFSPDPAKNLSNYISSWPDELKNPTSISRGIDYNKCEHIFVVKDNKWSEYTKGADCPYAGWTPIATLNTVPETLDIEWPQDVQNPDAVSLGWDKDGQRHIYAFKGNNYREYIDYNRPYIYQTTNNGLSYSLCAYFESAYPSLSGMNCSKLQGSNYPPAITKLTDQKVTIGNYFNYDIKASDIDGDPLSWSIDLGCGPTTLGSSSISCGWSGSTIYAANTSQKNIKKIYGTAPNAAENRIIKITVSDGNGGTDTKSFRLTVAKSNLSITSLPPANITIGDDYQYDVEAYDPQGYYPLTYIFINNAPSLYPPSMSSASINSTNGVIFGTPTNVGSYNVTATVRNSNPAGAETVSQPFTIRVNDFNIVNIPNTEIPREHTVNFFAKTNPEKVNRIKWDISCSSANADCDSTLPDDINYKIDTLSGEITIAVNNSAALNDVFTITVTAKSDLNSSIARSKSFNVTISNPKCGNGTRENIEQCDDGAGGKGNDFDQCYDDCKFTYCGDGKVQKPNGKDGINEDCDKNNPTCCDNASCQWSCSFPATNVAHAGPLNFYDNVTKNTANNITLQSGSVNGEIVFPACRIFDAGSGKIDAEVIPGVSSAAVVYVTDTSGSMGASMPEVKAALIAQMNNLNSAAKDQKMIDAKKSIFVGLVRFSSGFTSSPIIDIQNDTKKAALINDIGVYRDGGGTSAEPAFAQAVEMLDAVNYADKKIIVFLGDGDSVTDPLTTTTAAKTDKKIEIYGIAFNGGPASICSWSSDNGANCWSGKYSYKSANAASVYAAITSKMTIATGNIAITIKGKTSNFTVPVFPATTVADISLNFSDVACGDIKQNIPFTAAYAGGGGKIKFSNARVDICQSCNNTIAPSPPPGSPAVCGNGAREGAEQCDGGVGSATCASLGLGFTGGSLGCNAPGLLGECGFDQSACTTCGNGTREGAEQCDGADLGVQTCITQGFPGGGTLSCNAGSCTFNTSLCGGSCTSLNYSSSCINSNDNCIAFCAGKCTAVGEYGLNGYSMNCWDGIGCTGNNFVYASSAPYTCVAPYTASTKCYCDCYICPPPPACVVVEPSVCMGGGGDCNTICATTCSGPGKFGVVSGMVSCQAAAPPACLADGFCQPLAHHCQCTCDICP